MKSEEKTHQGARVQHRMMRAGNLLSLEGGLMEAGWATDLIKAYDRSHVRGALWRLKEWDRYIITSPGLCLVLTMSDLGHAGFDSVSLFDMTQKTTAAAQRTLTVGRSKRRLASSGASGTVRAQGKHYEITFRREGTRRHLYGHIYDFSGPSWPLLFDIILQELPGDSAVSAAAFQRHARCFSYHQVIPCMPAQGRVIHGEQIYQLTPANASGALDWGRGVWPMAVTRLCVCAAGIVQASRLGIYLGIGLGDSAAGESMLLVDGKAHKLGDVTIDIPRRQGREDVMGDWHMGDEHNRLSLTFTPDLLHKASHRALFSGAREQQLFGLFNGTARLSDGRELHISNLAGFAAKAVSRW